MNPHKNALGPFVLVMFLAGLVVVGSVWRTPAAPAAAQPGRVMISPATSTVNVGEITTIEVYIENAHSPWSDPLFAGQIGLAFDPTVVRVVDQGGNPATQIQRGDLLNPARVTEYVNVVDNTRGIIEYAATWRNDPLRPTCPGSGSGSFARIFFRGIGVGTSQVAFSTEGTTYVHEIKFVDCNLNDFTLPLEDGTINVTRTQMPTR